MDSILKDLASLAKDVNSTDSEDNVANLMFIFSKELHITPKEFMNLEIPLILDLVEEFNKFNKEQERLSKKRR